MAIWKVTAQGDELYIEADTQEQAKGVLDKNIGVIPGKYLRWKQVYEIPDGQELLNPPPKQ